MLLSPLPFLDGLGLGFAPDPRVATARFGQAKHMASYVLFAVAAALAAFMIGVWFAQRYKRRGSQGGRRY